MSLMNVLLRGLRRAAEPSVTRLALLVVVTGIFCAPAVIAQTIEQDREIEAAVRSRLEQAGLLTYVSEMRVRDGEILLGGEVPDDATLQRLIETAFDVDNVDAVDSELVVNPDLPPWVPPPAEPASPSPAPVASPNPPLSPRAPSAPSEPASAGNLNVASQASDQEIEEAVWARLKRENLDKELGGIEVSDGVVTLKGKVRNVTTRDKLIATALEVEHVEAVESDLEFIQAESGPQLVQDIVGAILRYPQHTVFDDVMVAEQGGQVTLLGVVTEPYKKDDLEREVSKVTGVISVDNQLRVLSVSPNDREIRVRLFNAIYGDQMFRHLASRANPPIHIIVESGNVVLKGVVNNRVQKMKAGSIARSVFGVFKVDNQLQTGS